MIRSLHPPCGSRDMRENEGRNFGASPANSIRRFDRAHPPPSSSSISHHQQRNSCDFISYLSSSAAALSLTVEGCS